MEVAARQPAFDVIITGNQGLEVLYSFLGDMNGDGVVDGADTQGFVDVILQPGDVEELEWRDNSWPRL